MRLAAALGAAVVLAGCSPASTIGGHDEPQLRRLAARATAACEGRRCEVPPSPFTTDGCSGWPDGRWQACCVEHDLVYWCGGTAEERRQADARLRACVASTGRPATAAVMYWSVRVGGHPWLPLPWRWGYGWPWPRGY
ncbi:MAG TPA: hypothetical protein VFX28_19970, partial [Methylomirabilota bacterium]|nr:hypothetical protein [Methylomirabilota bacterium]